MLSARALNLTFIFSIALSYISFLGFLTSIFQSVDSCSVFLILCLTYPLSFKCVCTFFFFFTPFQLGQSCKCQRAKAPFQSWTKDSEEVSTPISSGIDQLNITAMDWVYSPQFHPPTHYTLISTLHLGRSSASWRV